MDEEFIIDIDFDTTDGRNRRWNHLFETLDRMERIMTDVSQGLSDEQAAVTALTTVVNSVVSALSSLEAEVAALQSQGTVDPAALEAVAANINSLGAQLSAALPVVPAPTSDESPTTE